MMRTRLISRLRPTTLATALLLVGSAVTQQAWAQQTPRVEQDPGQRLLQEQKDRERERALNQSPPQITVEQPPPQTLPAGVDIESLPDTEPTFKIDHIELAGNTVLPAVQVEEITRPFIGKHLGSNRINLLLRRLTEAFVARGLITTRAYLGEQNLKDGKLIITVIPGKIEKITLNGQPLSTAQGYVASGPLQGGGWLTDRGVLLALPTAVGETLNLTDLEQGVDQINRLRRNKAEMQIQPGTTPGSSIVALNNPPGDRFWYNVGVDNYGSNQTGLVRTNLSAEADNLLGLQEMFSISYSGSLDTNALVGSVTLPVGYSTFSYTGAISEYQNLVGSTALLYGNTTSHTFGWNYVLSRSQAVKNAFDVTLARRKVARNVNDLDLDPQRLTVLRIGANTLHRFAFNEQQASWTLDIGLSQGLHALDASSNIPDISSGDAHSQFTKLDTTATLSLPLGKLGATAWNWRAQLNAQWSKQALFGSEQIFAGGMSSVRGFQDNSGTSGDRGMTLRNDVAWVNVPEFAGIHVEPYVFLDAGRTELIAQGSWQQLVGTGFGARMQATVGKQRFTGEVLLARALVQPDSSPPKSTLLLASLNWSY
ncbi:ShlB/FhaC/HecB family hemolysin secretion/activation protein [Collimonas humicola]|uniref:ShlB/FhaC/HecB family hemolysin secretion/activation protein n=1 Tax=Collimonas humicola TaxID=2825886 RepID=UPI001E3861FC|nr:ShlB/FhaC/HecB family hemolysin secretion/activation protein [Collimonas humicola]